MTYNFSKIFWDHEFDITVDDVQRISDFIKEGQSPVSLLDLSKKVIRGRLQYGEDLSPAALSNWSGKESIRLWDPSAKWKVNDDVIVIKTFFESKQLERKPVIGVIKEIDFQNNCASIRINEEKVSYVLAKSNSDNAKKWYNFVKKTVAKYASSSKLEDRVTAVFREFGGKIASKLQEVLTTNNRFINTGQFWFLSNLVEVISQTELIDLYRIITASKEPLSLEKIIQKLPPTNSDELIQKFKIQKALISNLNLFTPQETSDGFLYQAHIPDIDKAQIINYVYDPETYEIICKPGEQPTQKIIDRLKEIGLLAVAIGSQAEVIDD